MPKAPCPEASLAARCLAEVQHPWHAWAGGRREDCDRGVQWLSPQLSWDSDPEG